MVIGVGYRVDVSVDATAVISVVAAGMVPLRG